MQINLPANIIWMIISIHHVTSRYTLAKLIRNVWSNKCDNIYRLVLGYDFYADGKNFTSVEKFSLIVFPAIKTKGKFIYGKPCTSLIFFPLLINRYHLWVRFKFEYTRHRRCQIIQQYGELILRPDSFRNEWRERWMER